MGISGVDSSPVQSGSSLTFSSSYRSRKFALNRMKHLHLGVVLGAFVLLGRLIGGYLACLCVHTSVSMSMHLSVCQYIHLYVSVFIDISVSTFVLPYVPLYVPWDIWGFIHVLVRHPGVFV